MTRKAPSAGTERIDRIEKCHSGLCNSIVSSSKTVLLGPGNAKMCLSVIFLDFIVSWKYGY